MEMFPAGSGGSLGRDLEPVLGQAVWHDDRMPSPI